jgi:hypothetical protein
LDNEEDFFKRAVQNSGERLQNLDAKKNKKGNKARSY